MPEQEMPLGMLGADNPPPVDREPTPGSSALLIAEAAEERAAEERAERARHTRAAREAARRVRAAAEARAGVSSAELIARMAGHREG